MSAVHCSKRHFIRLSVSILTIIYAAVSCFNVNIIVIFVVANKICASTRERASTHVSTPAHGQIDPFFDFKNDTQQINPENNEEKTERNEM